MVRSLFELLQLRHEVLGRPANTGFQLELDVLEFTVEPKDPPPHAPAGERRSHAKQRVSNTDDRDQQDERPTAEDREPVWQIPLQEGGAGPVVLPGILGNGQVDLLRCWKFTGSAKQSRRRVNLSRGFHEQILDGRVQVLMDYQTGFGRYQVHIVRRPVGGEIADASRK